MALSHIPGLDRTADERRLPCCWTDLYPGEEHFREYKRVLKEENLFPLSEKGMSSGAAGRRATNVSATGLSEMMDETGVKGRTDGRTDGRGWRTRLGSGLGGWSGQTCERYRRSNFASFFIYF